jgi:PQQ-dependent dehydrogenase (methanol/ethanol family)
MTVATALISLVAIATWLMTQPGARAQGGAKTTHYRSMAQVSRDAKRDWPLHNLDLFNSRYSPLDEISASNVSKLMHKWSREISRTDNIGQATPLVIDGVMYFNAGSKLFALNAMTGEPVWTFEMEPAFPTRGRGPTYGDGRIYAHGTSTLYAVDAKTGKLVESFGEGGRLQVMRSALKFKYPDKYDSVPEPTSIGYYMVSPPAYFNGTLYVGAGMSDNHIAGGLLVALDGKTGAIKWVFNTVPQAPSDEGWEIAKNTWSGGARAGGGIWTQPAIDPALGMIYFNAANPSPDYDGSARIGINLFTNSTIALNLTTGKLAWYYQTIHHDLWDWDLVTGPVLFDVMVGGRLIKGIGAAGKNCFLYLWNRETGEPIHPIVETAVPTKTDVPGEQPWPTQPVPYNAKGVPLEPFCATYVIVNDPLLAKRAQPPFTPYSMNEFVLAAHGGSSWGSPSFSPRTGLLYVSAKNGATSFKVKPVGDRLRPDPGIVGHNENVGDRADTGYTPTETVTAYDPATGEQMWQTVLPANSPISSTGNLVTAGDIVFQGTGPGAFYALDARSGKQLFKFMAKRRIGASPLTYQVNGKQYVAVIATDTILTFGLP